MCLLLWPLHSESDLYQYVWCTRPGSVSQPRHLYVYWSKRTFVSHSMNSEQRQIITLSISVKWHDDLTFLHQGLPANYLAWRESLRQRGKCIYVCVFSAGVDSWKSDCSLWASVWQWETPNQRTSPHSTSSYWSRFNRPSKRALIWSTSPLTGHYHKRQTHCKKVCLNDTFILIFTL